MDDIGRRYLTLALQLDRHLEGVVDAYFGPEELKAEVEAGEPRSLNSSLATRWNYDHRFETATTMLSVKIT